MRIVIKNADFSLVSIGKVEEDLSFMFDSSNGAGGGEGHGDNATINAFFPNWNNGTPTGTEYYSGSEGGNVTMAGTTTNRIVSDYHKVSKGMTIEVSRIASGSTIPVIIAFDENKDIVSASCRWMPTTPPLKAVLLVPEGVRDVRFQSSGSQSAKDAFINGYVQASGTMPE